MFVAQSGCCRRLRGDSFCSVEWCSSCAPGGPHLREAGDVLGQVISNGIG